MDFVLVFLVALFFWVHGAYSGWKAREEYVKQAVAKLVENMKEEEEDSESLVHVTIEHHAGMFYVYDKTNNTFMAHGSTKQELEDALSSRFPGKQFAAALEELPK